MAYIPTWKASVNRRWNTRNHIHSHAKKLVRWPLWAFLLTLTAACGSDDDYDDDGVQETETETYIPERTVMVYMCGENNLGSNLSSDSTQFYSYLTVDLSEMIYGSFFLPPDSTHLVVYVDDASSSLPYIAEIKQGYMVLDTGMEFSEDIISTDPGQMEAILTYMMEAYPAQSYGLVLWGHADGWIVTNDTVPVSDTIYFSSPADTDIETESLGKKKSYGVDNGNNSSSTSGYWINIPTLADVLESLPNKLEYIFADCCQFQCIESLYELRNAANYIIGSPAEIPAVGAPYDDILSSLFDTSDDFYKGIVDNYNTGSTYSSYGGVSYTLPLSVAKTEYMEQLAQATYNILPELESDSFSVSSVIYYSSLPFSPTARVAIMYDMKDVMVRNVATSPYYDAWTEAFNQVVVYGLASDYWMTAGYVQFTNNNFTKDNYGGVSMFLPSAYYDRSNSPSPNETIKQFEWYYDAGLSQLAYWSQETYPME